MEAQPLALIVEDDHDLCASLSLLLHSMSIDSVLAYNGQAGLDALAQQRPAVILLDMMMPVLDGWEFLRQLDQRGLHDLPVIIVSANPKVRYDTANVKIIGFLLKPFSYSTLFSLVQTALAEQPASTVA